MKIRLLILSLFASTLAFGDDIKQLAPTVVTATRVETNRPINIGFVALYNIGMSLAMPVLSIAALDRFEKIRGTASSGQAFIQMLLSTVSAGLIVPFLWFSLLGLSLGMLGYFILSILIISQTKSLS